MTGPKNREEERVTGAGGSAAAGSVPDRAPEREVDPAGSPPGSPTPAGDPASGSTPHHQSQQQLRDMELIISRLLRIGVTVSSAIILLGLVIMVVTRSTGYGAVSTYHLKQILQYHPHREADFPTTVPAVIAGAMGLKPFAIVMAGALLLIATPVLRVAVSLVAFLLEGDRSYVLITLYVLVVLLVSFVIGRSIG